MRWISRVSNTVLAIEKRLITALAAVLVGLILLNIVTRAAGAAIFWVDELAIYAMIWMVLIGSSVILRMRIGISVTLMTDLLPRGLQRAVAILVDVIILFFALTLLVLSWQWYDPVALIRSGFDFDEFAQSTFKFIYSEPTSTIGIDKFWIWLVVPLMGIAMTIHAIANLLDGTREDPAPGGADASRLSEL
jgi:TRAP-type C4-dicarboxylate transport system permease small subunit